MKKTILGAGFLLLMSTVLLFGCTAKNSASTEEAEAAFTSPQYEWGNIKDKTLVVWGDKGDINRTYMKTAFSRYEELTGNKLEIVGLTKEEIDKKLPEVFATENADRPDILVSHGGTSLDNLNPLENFYDFTEAEWVTDLTDSAINQAVYNGKIVGLPHGEASISGTLYNKKIFSKYNIEVPTNQEEFMQACKTLKENGITPVYLPYKDITMLLYQFPMDSIVQDDEVLNAINDGSLKYSDIPEMKKIVQWYITMAREGYFGENFTEDAWEGINSAMKSEEYAMLLAWDTWLYTDYDGDPTDFSIMPAFMGVPDKGSFEGPNVMLMLADKKSPDLAASLDLITFMADPYNYNIAFKGINTAPVFNQQWESLSTPQYAESERLIDSLFYDSTAALRIKGFSQYDARYIQKCMEDKSYTVEDCLRDMDAARLARANGKEQ